MEVQNNNTFNYGIAVLRAFMCFEVVLLHFWRSPIVSYLIPFSMLKGLAVPTFMFLSFYLTGKTIIAKNNKKKTNRIKRILYPQIGWTLIYWMIYFVIQNNFDFQINVYDLIWQLFTGHSPKLNPSMWFQVVLLLITFTFFFVFHGTDKKRGIIIIIAFLFFPLIMQYSGINYHLFEHLRYELKYPLGRVFEMFPYASLGIICAYFEVFTRFDGKKCILLGIMLLSTIVLLKYRILPPADGFGYSYNNNILLSFSIVGLFFLLPFDRLPISFKEAIKYLSRYTLGIYSSHRLIAFFVSLILPVDVKSFVGCILIYILGFVLSHLFCVSFGRYGKYLVD